ncbi:MAG: sigma-54-dependent Fis family transcriptional regulator [Nitrospirae bacterium]|nr:sigma-54-dependent Fis family transcriptional regulator [Nitrospirota bacterium]
MVERSETDRPRILVIDDDESMRFFIAEALSKDGYPYDVAVNGEEALRKLSGNGGFGIALLDVRMPQISGLDVLKKAKEIDPELVVILMTAYDSRDIAMESIRRGAYDYFTKPFDLNEMRIVVGRAAERIRLRKDMELYKKEVEAFKGQTRLIGTSPKVRDVMDLVKRVSDNDVTVLVTGESGTGKELVARIIHESGLRRSRPFAAVNCAAIPENLLEEELFGHEKGSFTGALQQKKGKIEHASGGTLFLDEIGDMGPAMQAKLLRFLQEREFERIGGVDPIRADVRVVAATNQDLRKRVQEGEFRDDLYWRLNVIAIHLPPLRDRTEDIPDIVNHFLSLYRVRLARESIERITPSAMDLLLAHLWPGNVRELENVIQKLVVLTDRNEIQPRDVQPFLAPPSEKKPEGRTLFEKLDGITGDAEKEMILQALERNRWSRTRTADELGISRKSLHNKMKKYAIATDTE